jgi:serine/threonine-protein kinase
MAASSWDERWDAGSLGTVGRFQLREVLGKGAFGQVYQAFDPRLDRDVALKLLRQADPSEQVMRRFFREARAAGRLDHPNIVAVHDAGRDDGRCWIACEYIKGPVLSNARLLQRIDLTAAVRIVRDLADALDHAHRRGVFHRDVKPDNVLVDERGRPRLIDFGLAKREDLDWGLTLDGAVLGTPAYMSPEQSGGLSNRADDRSDIFSLGVLFYELLHGHRPGSTSDGGHAGQANPPDLAASIRTLIPVIPAELDLICEKAMAHDPGARYPDARAMAQDLDRWLQPTIPAPPPPRLAAGIFIGFTASLFLSLVILFTWMEAGEGRPRPTTSGSAAMQTGRSARRVRRPFILGRSSSDRSTSTSIPGM